MQNPVTRAGLTAARGIDGCGKGHTAAQNIAAVQAQGIEAVTINIDGWLNLPQKLFAQANPAEHFCLHGIRFPEMFDQLVLPLRDRRSVRLVADHLAETAIEYRPQTYDFRDVHVIVL